MSDTQTNSWKQDEQASQEVTSKEPTTKAKTENKWLRAKLSQGKQTALRRTEKSFGLGSGHYCKLSAQRAGERGESCHKHEHCC